MSGVDFTIFLTGVSQLLFGILLGWLRWGRACKQRHNWVPRHFLFDSYEQCDDCGRVR